jgi:hypothetical protein
MKLNGCPDPVYAERPRPKVDFGSPGRRRFSEGGKPGHDGFRGTAWRCFALQKRDPRQLVTIATMP